MIAYIICMNDGMEAVVMDNKKYARELMEQKAKDYYENNKWNFSSVDSYRSRCYWHIHDIFVSDIEGDKPYKVWECKIVVSKDAVLPRGFDNPPRQASIKAVESAGVNVISCFSGWSGNLTDNEKKIVDEDVARNGDTSFKDPTHITGDQKDINELLN